MKVSLITACYNSAVTIHTCFDSVLSQQGVDLEYIVVDGGSKDGTVDIVKEYASKTSDQRAAFANATAAKLTTNDFSFKWLSERDRGMYDAILAVLVLFCSAQLFRRKLSVHKSRGKGVAASLSRIPWTGMGASGSR